MFSSMSEAKPLPNGTGHDDEFKKIVEESRQRISQEVLETSPTPIKRRPGRPKKVRPDAPPAAASDPSPRAEVAAPQAPIDITPMLERPLIALSKIPANRHGIPELALDAQEAKACAESFNALLQAFVPNIGEMSPKTAAVISTCAVVGSITFSKYQIYLEKRATVEPTEEPAPEDLPAGQIFPTQNVSALDAFRTPGQ